MAKWKTYLLVKGGLPGETRPPCWLCGRSSRGLVIVVVIVVGWWVILWRGIGPSHLGLLWLELALHRLVGLCTYLLLQYRSQLLSVMAQEISTVIFVIVLLYVLFLYSIGALSIAAMVSLNVVGVILGLNTLG